MAEENWEGEKARVTAILWLVALIFVMVLFAVIYQNEMIMSMNEKGPHHQCYMLVSNDSEFDINVTVYVLDGGEWDQIEFPLSIGNQENLTIEWYGETTEVIVVVYVEGNGCWRYILQEEADLAQHNLLDLGCTFHGPLDHDRSDQVGRCGPTKSLGRHIH